jgi:sulfatase modifying factor 1
MAPSTAAITPSTTPIARPWTPLIGGSFRMGSEDRRFPDDGEGPVRHISVTASLSPATPSAICNTPNS